MDSGGARKLNDTSMEEASDNENKVRMVEAPWEELLQSNRDVVQKMDDNFRTLDAKLEDQFEKLNGRLVVVEEKQKEQDSEIDALKMEVTALREENAELKGNYVMLRRDLDSQIDRSLRDHLNFFGLKETKPEKNWADTENRLVEWLAANAGDIGDAAYFRAAIVRAHRNNFVPGKEGPRPIFCQMDFKVAEKLRKDLGTKQTAGVWVRDHFSPSTQDRRNRALMFRKQFKSENPGSKAYIAFPAVLKAKKLYDEDYVVVKKF